MVEVVRLIPLDKMMLGISKLSIFPRETGVSQVIRCGHRLLHGLQRRCFHAADPNEKQGQSNASKDTRLAGRLRFYKQVGVVSVDPPWETRLNGQGEKSGEENWMESPISAGVDGTQSASGVHHLPPVEEKNALRDLLSPRTPGSSVAANADDGDWFGVTLDGRVLKSPMGQTLALPSQHLAYAVAAEWDSQEKHLQPSQMPLMTLTCTALDQAAFHPNHYRQQALAYLPTDTVSSPRRARRIVSLAEMPRESDSFNDLLLFF